MLTPNQLSNIPSNIVELFEDLEDFIIIDISRRLKKAGSITSTAEYQLLLAKLMNIKNVEAKIQETLKLSQKQIEDIFPEVAATTINSENEIFKKAGYKTIDFPQILSFVLYSLYRPL
jgi:Ni,Fe-hydrogenase maturation factor